MLKGLDAFSNREVVLGAIFADNKEASGLLKLRMATDFESLKIFHFALCIVVELDQFFDKFSVISLKTLSIFLQIHDSS